MPKAASKTTYANSGIVLRWRSSSDESAIGIKEMLGGNSFSFNCGNSQFRCTACTCCQCARKLHRVGVVLEQKHLDVDECSWIVECEALAAHAAVELHIVFRLDDSLAVRKNWLNTSTIHSKYSYIRVTIITSNGIWCSFTVYLRVGPLTRRIHMLSP